MTGLRATVLFADVVRSRADSAAATSWLRVLTSELEAAYSSDERLAPFGFTQGDELQALLAPSADPIAAVVRGGLHPTARPMRWAIAHGEVDAGSGPATERTGPAFLAARRLLDAAAARRDGLLVATGDPESDELLDDLAPLLAERLDDLTARQREVARLLLVEGIRRSDAAVRLGVSRATVSVVAERAGVRGIGRLADALGRIVRTGIEARA
ncbi:MAG: hypothetical protein ACJ761_05175 [Chloroflexota bacterium]